MRIFVAGATGAIGRVLLPALVADGHQVAGLTRKIERVEWLASVGAVPILCDVFDPALNDAVASFAPDAVVHQLTDLPADVSEMAAQIPALNRVRTEGTDLLIAAAKAAGATRFLAQSIAFDLRPAVREAVEHLEAATLAYPGVVARYGYFHGPGTWYPDGTEASPRVHVATAAARTVELLSATPGVYEVVDPD